MNKVTYLTIILILLYIFIPHFILPVTPFYRFIILNLFLLYLLINLLLQKKVGIGTEQYEKYPEKFSLSTFIKSHILLFFLILLNLAIHIYPIVSRTILLGYDEPTLAQSGLGLFTRISSTFDRFFKIEFLSVSRAIFIIICLVLFLFRKKIIFTKKKIKSFSNLSINARVSLILVLILISYIYFIFTKNIEFHGSLFRYPPISKFLYFLFYSIFGIKEFAPRMAQVILGSIGVVYLYRIILLYYEKKAAIFGVILFMFNPLISYYFNYAELGLGTISIVIIISFYFIRFLKYKFENDILLTFLTIGLGFLYKRSILLMIILIPSYLLFSDFSYIKKNFLKILKLLWLSLIPILPFFIIMSHYTPRGYKIDLSILSNKISQYLIILINSNSYLIILLFSLSIFFILFKEKNHLTLFNCTLFIVFYLFYAMDFYSIAVDRFSLAFIPTIAIITSTFIYKIFNKKKFILNGIITLIGIYIISISTFVQLPEIQPKLVLYKNLNLEHYPTDVALKWIKKNIKNKNILSLQVNNTAFYRDKLKIKKERIVSMSIKTFNKSSRDDIEKFLSKNNIGCILTSNFREPYKKDNINLYKFDCIKEFKYKNGNNISLIYDCRYSIKI